MSELSVLCVDPDEDRRAETVAALGDVATEIEEAGTVDGANDDAAELSPDCVVTEYDLPDGTALDLVSAVRSVAPDAGCIVYSAVDRASIAPPGESDVVVDFVASDEPGAAETLRAVVEATAAFKSQTSYPLPARESERLEALSQYDLDDPALRASFDRILELAREHFDVPTASINVVAEHEQEFLVCRGAEWQSSTREASVCTFTILEEGVTVVDDLHADPRFENVEGLREMGIRFYAGVPLAPTGDPIATLCVYDFEPGSFSDEDEAYLETLGRVAEDLLAAHGGDAVSLGQGVSES